MDGDAVEAEPSEPKRLVDIFREVFPYYLAMGMSYNEFWYGNPSLVCDYRKAWEIKQKNEEYARWRSGMYFYDALLKVAPVLRPFAKGRVEPGKYPDRPFPLTEKEAKEQEEQRERENFFAYVKRMEAESERNKKKMESQKKEAINDGQQH